MVEMKLTVKNRAGIHARPAALICEIANKFECSVIFESANLEVNAKSVLGIITMGAGYNSVITLKTDGRDEEKAANAIKALFEKHFEED